MFRLAKKSDADELLQMFRSFYLSEAVDHNIPDAFHEYALQELFSDRKTSLQRCYIAEIHGKIAGYALLSLKFSHEAGGNEWWIEELYFKPQFRGMKLGTKMMDFLLDEAKKEKVFRVRLEVEPDNDIAIELYKNFGFEYLEYPQMVYGT